MGYDTHFHGKLKFTRNLSASELRWVNSVVKASPTGSTEISDAIWQKAKDEQVARGHGPIMVHGPDASQMAAAMQGFITRDDLSADYASALRISDEFDGLIYCAEKTYDMVAGVNFIIVNARTRIPDFGLAGELLADTEFDPWFWLVEIGDDGLARRRKISGDEFFRKRRDLYPKGYDGWGAIDPQDRQREEADTEIRKDEVHAIESQTRGERLFVRSARGDGTGIITLPADMQQETRNIVLDHWAEWSLAYLWQCGHHRDELTHVAPSLRSTLGKWWDAHNEFDAPGSGGQFFPEGKQWNVFWKPSTATVGDSDHNRDASIYKQGWDDAVAEVARQQPTMRPKFYERLVSIFRRRAQGNDAV